MRINAIKFRIYKNTLIWPHDSNNFFRLKKIAYLPLLFALSSCGESSTPQAQVILDMNAAICRERSLIAAKPYLTKDSQFALELTQIFIPLAEAVAGQELQDAYAKGCRYPPKVIDQLQVNAHRYLIRYVDADGEKEAVVVLENGKWKIRLK